MFRIGAFSQVTGVTIKALRYYDRVGVLKPAEVDRFTGYRYYTVGQIDRLNRILALKDLGLSLDEIGRVLCENPPAAELRGMLRLKRAQLRQTIDEEQARLERVEARLRQIEREGQMPAHEVVIRQVPALRVLSYREVLPHPRSIKPFFMRVNDALIRDGIEPAGPWLALYHQGEYREYDLDVEAATICRMESQTDVYTANRDLGLWIAENGYQIESMPCREVYATKPQPGEPIIFEVQLAITR